MPSSVSITGAAAMQGASFGPLALKCSDLPWASSAAQRPGFTGIQPGVESTHRQVIHTFDIPDFLEQLCDFITRTMVAHVNQHQGFVLLPD